MHLPPTPSPAFMAVLNEYHRKSFRKSTPTFSTFSPNSSTSCSYSPIYSSPLANSDLSFNESNNDSESLDILNKKFLCKHFKGFHHRRDIAEIKDVMINLYRDADPKKKKDRPQIIGYVNINTSQILSRHPVERWFVYILYYF
uniref:Uncharacterized protein n=1 Tax=Panagrolaimus sp. PS1159 TaxID=55785 RepID=A0AC35F7S9_9BILA